MRSWLPWFSLQRTALQDLTWGFSPVQGWPPHSRDLVIVPPPQVLLQELQGENLSELLRAEMIQLSILCFVIDISTEITEVSVAVLCLGLPSWTGRALAQHRSCPGPSSTCSSTLGPGWPLWGTGTWVETGLLQVRALSAWESHAIKTQLLAPRAPY